jgi:hypothetical protein
VATRELSPPVGRRELASRAIQITSEITRVIESFGANLFDRLQKRALEQILGRITIDAPVVEYLQQGPPISHVKLILQLAALGDGLDQGEIAPIGPFQGLL